MFWNKAVKPITLEAIYLATSAGNPMQLLKTAKAIKASGLQGDRYAENKGYWISIESCEVTLITQCELDKACQKAPEHLHNELLAGGHRRNLVIANIKPKKLIGRSFKIGSAIFRYHKPRPPCGYIDQIEGKGICRALGKQSGVCIQVTESGTFQVGDEVILLDD